MWSKSLEKQRNIDLWCARKSSGMDHSKAAWDKRSSKWVTQITEDEDAKKRSSERVRETGDYLRSKGLLGRNDTVIDIGCGPGRFVCEFAKSAGHVTGTDISSEMCRFGEIFAKELELDNVDFVPCNFKETDIKEMGWEKSFDLVFSSITPAMSTYESMRKAETMSRGFCFQSNYVKINDPLVDEVFIRVLEPDQMPPERSFQSVLPLFNILCLEDKFPEIRFYKEESDKKYQVNAELVHQIMKNAPKVELTDSLEKKVIDILSAKADEDGLVEKRTQWTYAWILWNVNGILINER